MSEQTLTLPPVPLSAVTESTKDFMLAFCNQRNLSPAAGMIELLDGLACRAGFSPKPTQPEAQATAAMAA